MSPSLAVPVLLLFASGVGLMSVVPWRGPGARRRRRGRRAEEAPEAPLRDVRSTGLPRDTVVSTALSERPRLWSEQPLLPDEPPLRPDRYDVRPQRLFGYASWDGHDGVGDVRRQAEQMASECERVGATLLQLVREREPQRGRALERPGLGYAMDSIAAGEADGLVVTELSRLTRSAAELGRLLQWFLDSSARLIVVAAELDTEEEAGRLAVRMLIEVSRWEHERLVQRTRNGMLAARRKGPPGVADYPQLKQRIIQMRAAGMTLEAIAAQLNGEGIPTVRGGAKWRPSSVQVAAGYRRPPAGHRSQAQRNGAAAKSGDGNR